MDNIISNFKKSNILIIGDIILDQYWYVKNQKKKFEKSAPIKNIKKIENRAGGAANVAKNISKMGGNVHLIGIIGNDLEGSIVKNLINDNNIKHNLIINSNATTIKKIRIISEKKQLIRLDLEEKYFIKNKRKILDITFNIIKNYDVIIISDYNKGTLEETSSIIKIAKKLSIPVIIDPKKENILKYLGATLLTPNLEEFQSIVGKCKNKLDLIKKGKNLISKLKLSALLITQAESGMTLIQNKKNPIHFQALSKNVNDPTGAGDTVVSMIGLILSLKKSFKTACLYANVAASIVVKKLGTATVGQKELLKKIKSFKNVKMSSIIK
ncbi:PfkB family carbohydrate kinase [Buchnera aphidicola (Mindarus keteleerifoliae)]|uniref:bifunctional heptose 7-phosphate kinase/heptose 1-phosphate adenyltransferase n=1 Tax=Buchnera aphidicola TaxID=9 RepID=UPI0031B6CC2D